MKNDQNNHIQINHELQNTELKKRIVSQEQKRTELENKLKNYTYFDKIPKKSFYIKKPKITNTQELINSYELLLKGYKTCGIEYMRLERNYKENDKIIKSIMNR